VKRECIAYIIDTEEARNQRDKKQSPLSAEKPKYDEPKVEYQYQREKQAKIGNSQPMGRTNQCGEFTQQQCHCKKHIQYNEKYFDTLSHTCNCLNLRWIATIK